MIKIYEHTKTGVRIKDVTADELLAESPNDIRALKEKYKTAVTIDQKIEIIEKALGLK